MLWVAYWMTRPLDRLARAASAIEAAGHQVRVPETGALEVRRLGRAINGLLERLREDVAERAKIMAGVSHDLRTPLTRLRLRVETIQDTRLRQGLGADLTLIEGIVSSSMALLEADLRQEPVEALDIAALAATICDQFVDAGFDVAYAGPLHHVIRAQPVALERALNNLVENACKHAVGARLVMAEEEGAIRIAVEDRGPGIAEADLPHVTEAFRRPLKNDNGFGLGLAIVASVARAHGGQLRLTNRSGGGLSAELRLPAMEVA
jgi:signal transduction histidine kinase